MDDAPGAEISLEAKNFRHSSRSGSLHDGRIHHEYRSTAPVPGTGVRTRHPLHGYRRIRRLLSWQRSDELSRAGSFLPPEECVYGPSSRAVNQQKKNSKELGVVRATLV